MTPSKITNLKGLSQANLVEALNLGLINWFQFFEHWRKL